MDTRTPLTSTDILASASEALLLGGYSRIRESVAGKVSGTTRIFEDPYGVVQIVVYETWADLESNWTDAQAVLVELISKFLNSTEPKAWDGYLVLVTPSVLPESAQEQAVDIRNNTNRVRKLLATGDELKTTADVERLLLPLLPLSSETAAKEESGGALDALPDFLTRKGISGEAVKALVTAFREHQPLMEYLHRYRSNQ
jgi:hypothetical protein